MITDTKMIASRAEKAMEVAALLLIDEGALRTHLSYTSDEETFGDICFMTLRWAYPQSYQVAKYVNAVSERTAG